MMEVFAKFAGVIMEDLIEALQIVLNTDLLAKNNSRLSNMLGYKGRQTIKSIQSGKSGENALAHFCTRLNESLYISEKTLFRIANIIVSESEFSKIIRNHCDTKDPDFPFKVVLAFVSHDFSFFDRDFQETLLNDFLQLERNDPEALYIILSYFYIKAKHLDFYKGTKPHLERCANIIEPIGQRLIELYPENGVAAANVYAYSNSKIYKSEAETLWSLLTSMSAMLRFFAHPVDTLKDEQDIRRLSGIGDRAYWQGKNPDEVILTWYMPGSSATNGHYEVIKINRETHNMEDTASITILSDEILTLFSKPECSSELGCYSWSGTQIDFTWEKEGYDPMRTGNSWTLLKLSNSQSLREIDRRVSDDDIMQEVLRSEGFESEVRLSVTNVIISRDKFILEMKNGQRYSIDTSDFPFLNTITPSESVMVCRYKRDDTLFVIWPAIKHSIPLEFFVKSQE